MPTEPHSQALRSGRFSAPGMVYLVTAVTAQRRAVFADFAAARHLIRCMHHPAMLERAATLAFVVMPDHLHWLMQLQAGAQLSECVQRLKSMSTRGIAPGLWQRGFHDHALRREEDLPALARYVVANPVRAGLCPRTGAYPHWDALWL
ncbi:MAG: REP-associated tyrosine transposase [Rhodoferax sp.]